MVTLDILEYGIHCGAGNGSGNRIADCHPFGNNGWRLGHDFLGEFAIIISPVAGGSVHEDRLTEAGTFCQLDVPAYSGVKDARLVPGNGSGAALVEVTVQVAQNFLRELGGRFAQAQNDSGHHQVRIDALADQGRGFEQFTQAVQGEKVRLQRDEDFRGSGQGIEGQYAQGRRAIHQDVIKIILVGLQEITENDFPADDPGQFHLRGGQVNVGSDDPEVVLDLAAHLGKRPVVDEHVVHGRRLAVRLDAQVRGGVRLRIQIEHADALLRPGQGGREIDRGGGLADAALLIDDRDPSHGVSWAMVGPVPAGQIAAGWKPAPR